LCGHEIARLLARPKAVFRNNFEKRLASDRGALRKIKGLASRLVYIGGFDGAMTNYTRARSQ
jgi:hypothetical protein